MMGILLGLLFGGVQLYLLLLAVNSLAKGQLKVWPLALQFFCPMMGLLVCALTAREYLIPCAATMSVLLIGGAVVKLIAVRKGKKG